MQVVETWFWECNQIIQNDSVWGDHRYKWSTPICVETLENGNGEEPLRKMFTRDCHWLDNPGTPTKKSYIGCFQFTGALYLYVASQRMTWFQTLSRGMKNI